MKRYSENEYIIKLLEDQAVLLADQQRRIRLLESRMPFRSTGATRSVNTLFDTQVTGRTTSNKHKQ